MHLTRFLPLVVLAGVLAACAPLIDTLDEDLADAPSVPKASTPAAAPATAQAAVALGVTPALALAPKADNEMRTHFLAVGAGLCTITECPGTGNPNPILYDCGSSGGSVVDLDESQAAAYVDGLLKGNADAAPIVVVSHSDSDHNNWIPTVMSGRLAQSIWLGGNVSSYPSAFRTWLNAQRNAGVPVSDGWPAGWHNGGQPVEGLACGTGETNVLTVNAGTNANDRSLVLELNNENYVLTLTGDATGVTQNSAIANWQGLGGVRSNVLLGSHHGADTNGSNSEAWADATGPNAVVYSAGLKFYHPRCAATAVYEEWLLSADSHAFQCGVSGGWSGTTTTTDAQYVTEDTGTVVVTGDEDADFSVTCGRSASCGLSGAGAVDAVSERQPANDDSGVRADAS